MPDRNGDPVPSDFYGISEVCTECGGPVPTLDEQHCLIYEEDGNQLCEDCSVYSTEISSEATGEVLWPN